MFARSCKRDTRRPVAGLIFKAKRNTNRSFFTVTVRCGLAKFKMTPKNTKLLPHQINFQAQNASKLAFG